MRFSNEPKDIYKNIDKLPIEMVDIIYSYIPKTVTVFLNKQNYIENHHLIRTLINKVNIEKYIRMMVRQDNEFVFHQLLIENAHRWINMNKYYYKECIYGNYLDFLEEYAIEYESTNCRNKLLSFLEEQGLSKNRHKKNTIRYIRWRN
jgi:hypothetical protein